MVGHAVYGVVWRGRDFGGRIKFLTDALSRMGKNKFNIPEDILTFIRERDRSCAYCRKGMVFPYDRTKAIDSATIEHLNRDGPFYWEDGLSAEDIVICCGACNSSRGAKLLTEWFGSRYCVERTINSSTVAEPVQTYLLRNT